MIIRKQFKFEGAHIVRNCSSDRCKKSIHGHSYIVEVFLESSFLDRGGMVLDFGLMKGSIKDIIDSFDHAYSMWDKEKDDFKEFIQSHSDRWVKMPITPSAEGYSLIFFLLIDRILKNTSFQNGEAKDLRLHKVRVHETTTGYAEAYLQDIQTLVDFGLTDIEFSPSIREDWSTPFIIEDILDAVSFRNPEVEVTHE